MVKQGQIIRTDFDPQIGHEQKGWRPALLVSNKSFNFGSNLAIVCPITNTNKECPFYVKLDYRTKTTGVILCNQVKALDIYSRDYDEVEKVPYDILLNVLDIIRGFFEVE